MKDCNKTKDVSTRTQLCPACEKIITGSVRREDNQDRQNTARSNTQDLHRDLNVSLSPNAAAGITQPSGSGASQPLAHL